MRMRHLSTSFLFIIFWLLQTNSEFVSKDPKTFEKRLKQARTILDEVPLIDGHNEIGLIRRGVIKVPLKELSSGYDAEPEPQLTPSGQYDMEDIKLLKEGMVASQFWDVWVPCLSASMNPVLKSLEQIDSIKQNVNNNSELFQIVDSPSAIIDAFVDEKIAILLGLEGGHIINSSIPVLRTLYQAGVQYMTLTHACRTHWATSIHEMNKDKEDSGLTLYGEEVIKEMNRLGMVIDLSHASHKTIRDVFRTSAAPVIFSHSSAYGLCRDVRNIPDDLLRDLTANGGVIMVNFDSELLTCSQNATLFDVIDHINYIRNITGVRHIGIGSGFSTNSRKLEGLEDVSMFPQLFAELLLEPQWTEKDIEMLAGYNFLKMFHAVKSVKNFMQDEDPYEMIIPKMIRKPDEGKEDIQTTKDKSSAAKERWL